MDEYGDGESNKRAVSMGRERGEWELATIFNLDV
jgi:hypothetical protein